MDGHVENRTRVQDSATQCREIFDHNKISVTAIMERDIASHKVLHTDQNDVWVYNGRKKLTLYDGDFVQKEVVKVTDDLHDMVLTSTQDIIATNSRQKLLVKISLTGVSTLCSTAPLAPLGLCINNKQQLVVGLQPCYNTAPIKLVIYSPDGSSVLKRIENYNKQPLFKTGVMAVKQNRKGDYLVADFGRMICVSSKGWLKWKYDMNLILGLPSSLPISDIVYDKYDNIITADYYKICLLNSEGKLINILLTEEDGISGPRSLSIDRHGKLWIGQRNSLRVFKYLK